MAKISPVSIKYMIHADFYAEGALEKPDIIGALFGQTEGLLGADLEMRDLQKEGKIGRIEVNLERKDKVTKGKIQIPTALDQSETTLIAAAIETIDRIGPCDSNIEVEKIEDVRGSKRDYIIERAKRFMTDFNKTTDSREISNQIKESARMAAVQEYGRDKLPYGEMSGKELIVVEGRADVLNLLRNGINNVIAMNGTKLPDDIKKLGQEKDLTLFVDGDRGGKLIVQNVVDNAKIKSITVAPEGKEVEELNGKEIWIALRKKMPTQEFIDKAKSASTSNGMTEKLSEIVGTKPVSESEEDPEETKGSEDEIIEDSGEPLQIGEEERAKLKQVSEANKGSEKAILLDRNLEQIKEVSVKGLAIALKKSNRKPSAIVIDGTATGSIINAADEAGCKAIAAKNFASTSDNIKLLSL